MADNRNHNHGPNWVTTAGFRFLTVNSGLAIYRAKGDPASIIFVAGCYLTLLLLFCCLRDYERVPPGSPERERASRAVWSFTTVPTVRFAWKIARVMPLAVPAVVWVMWDFTIAATTGGCYALFVFITVFYVTLLLLFACLRTYECLPPGSPASERARRAVWALATLLTWKVAVIFLPSAVPVAFVWDFAIATTAGGFFALFLFVAGSYLALVLLFACLRNYERAPPARERQLGAALMMVAFGAMACDAALAVHDALGDHLASAAFVLIAYAALLTLTSRFLGAFPGRARGVGHGLGHDQQTGVVADDAADGHACSSRRG